MRTHHRSGWLPGDLDDPVAARPERRSARDWLVDVSLFLICTGLGVLLWIDQADLERGTMPGALAVADLVAGVPCLVLLWWRRRWPTRIAVFMAAVGFFSVVSALPAMVLVYTVAVRRPPRNVAVVFVLHVLAGIAFAWVRPNPSDSWADLVAGLIAVCAVLAWGLFARARRQLILSLRDRAERAESERNLLLEQARQSERTRIAREMHDVLGHRISLISLHAGALEFRADKAGPEVAESAAVIRASARQALQDLREVIGVLRAGGAEDSPDRPQPTLADIPSLVEESRQAGMKVTLNCEHAEGQGVPEVIGRTVYRIVQEGLTNARKHAPGTAVQVSVNGTPGQGLEVTVLNRAPLAPPDAIPGAGQGLVGLTERVNLAEGSLEHGRTAAGDFRLAARLPWPTNDEELKTSVSTTVEPSA
ncbi:histidine kinase [Kineosporia rhizophila]|uniref:sensor histidine kinase n=1 Tax=Kineosporia TaxID=49184 RepID=UPI001E321E23|nr:histidine kinase [Kineosporia sp. NBRC 101677]MCE0540151.1 histidine kinase [Kineosporia rhizophila]GLY14347.1 two-component sensor histidine kinase [Kineosporia sp. NBRC 101677]